MPFSGIVPQWPDAPAGIASLYTERAGGKSRSPYDDGQDGGGMNLGMHVGDEPQDVLENRRLLRSVLPSAPIWLTQVHGNTVLDADAFAEDGACDFPEADAVVTAVPGRVCAIQTADCLPVLFCSMDGKVVGAAHAGWRGLAAGVLQNTVRAMHQKGAGEIAAWLGPAIGPQRFEVGPDVFDAFTSLDENAAAAFKASPDGRKYLADIYLLAKMSLKQEGVSCVAGGGFCTVSEKSRFYSYRRDGVTGRMVSLVWIK